MSTLLSTDITGRSVEILMWLPASDFTGMHVNQIRCVLVMSAGPVPAR